MSKINNFVEVNRHTDYLHSETAKSALSVIRDYENISISDKLETLKSRIIAHLENYNNPHNDQLYVSTQEFYKVIYTVYTECIDELYNTLLLDGYAIKYEIPVFDKFYILMSDGINALLFIRNLTVAIIKYNEYMNKPASQLEMWYTLVKLPDNIRSFITLREQYVFDDINPHVNLSRFIYTLLPKQIPSTYTPCFNNGKVYYDQLRGNYTSDRPYTYRIQFDTSLNKDDFITVGFCNSYYSRPTIINPISSTSIMRRLKGDDDATTLNKDYDLPIYPLSGITLNISKDGDVTKIKVQVYSEDNYNTKLAFLSNLIKSDNIDNSDISIDLTNDTIINIKNEITTIVVSVSKNSITFYMCIGVNNYKITLFYNKIFTPTETRDNVYKTVWFNTNNKTDMLPCVAGELDINSNRPRIRNLHIYESEVDEQLCYDLTKIIL